MAFVPLTSHSSVVAAVLMRPNIAAQMCRSKLYCVVCSRDAVSNPVMCIIYDHAGSFAVAINIANVHLRLWTSSNSSVASSLAWKIINLLFR